jgi:hypothetical protein
MFREADCGTDHYLVVAEIRESLPVTKRAEQKFGCAITSCFIHFNSFQGLPCRWNVWACLPSFVTDSVDNLPSRSDSFVHQISLIESCQVPCDNVRTLECLLLGGHWIDCRPATKFRINVMKQAKRFKEH